MLFGLDAMLTDDNTRTGASLELARLPLSKAVQAFANPGTEDIEKLTERGFAVIW